MQPRGDFICWFYFFDVDAFCLIVTSFILLSHVKYDFDIMNIAQIHMNESLGKVLKVEH